MSQYTSIFLQKGETFIEVSCTSRNNALSEMFANLAPWEKIRELSKADLDAIYSEYKEDLNRWREYRKNTEERKKLIATFNNSVEDKMEAIQECDNSIEETTETIEDLECALARVAWFSEIIWDGAANVWVGCECGSNVTFEDDVNWKVPTDSKNED